MYNTVFHKKHVLDNDDSSIDDQEVKCFMNGGYDVAEDEKDETKMLTDSSRGPHTLTVSVVM